MKEVNKADINALCRVAAKKALTHLKKICDDDSQRAQDRIAAAKVLLEYGVGRDAGKDEGDQNAITVTLEGVPSDWL